MSETKNPSSVVGLKKFTLAPITEDIETGTTYGTIVRVPGLIEATVTPSTTDADIQYADDVEYDALNPDPDIALKVTMADFPLDVQSKLFGSKLNADGTLWRNASDKAPYFAVGFMSEKADGTYRYVWLLKTRAKPLTENYKTKEGTTITRQTGEIEFTAIKRISDGNYQVVADEGLNSFTGGATFLDKVPNSAGDV